MLASQKWIKAARSADLSRLSTGPPCDSSIDHITALVAWDSTYGVNTASRRAVCPRIRRFSSKANPMLIGSWMTTDSTAMMMLCTRAWWNTEPVTTPW